MEVTGVGGVTSNLVEVSIRICGILVPRRIPGDCPATMTGGD